MKDLERLPDRRIGEQVRELITQLEQAKTLQDIEGVKKLRGAEGYYRLRIGDYRLGLVLAGDTVTLVRFLHRKEIYRHFP